MVPDKIIYTDGRDVTVTDSELKVRNSSYQLNGITKLGMWTIRPHRWPGILLLLAGFCAMACAYLNLIPETANIEYDRGVIGATTLGWITGGALSLLGLILLSLSRKRYAVRISTAEGEKNAVVSEKREYIAQIVDALNRAFRFERSDSYDQPVVR
jgi:hypothetical protein